MEKRWIYFLIVTGILTIGGCAKTSDISDLQSQIEGLKSGQIATIENQINSITSSISSLQEADREIKGYITALQNTASELQKSINSADGKIDDLENALALVNSAIENLKAKDSALEQRISDLKDYVDTQLRGAKDWVSATFATLEQYNGIVSEIGGIKGSISSINTAIEQMESRLNGKITLMKGEIEEAYTKAIGSLESSLKNWVNEQLEGYWTIAETEGKLETLEGNLTQEDESIRGDIGNLRASLDSAKTELTEGYKAAIKKAIEENNGVIDVKIASLIEEVNNSISSLGELVTDLETRMSSMEKSIEKLFSRIQSINVVPSYHDGSVGIIDEVTDICFEVLPRSVSVEIAKLGENAFSLDAVYAQTRSSAFINLPVLRVVDNGEFLVVTTKGKNLGKAFFDGHIGALARLKVSDGNIEKASGFFSLYATPVVDLSVNGTANCYIVSKAGTYKFNASVKGNSTESVGTPVSTEVLWESFGTNETPEVGDIISKAAYSGGYITITTPSILKDGNAVIAVKDDAGIILWSWHIWVCYGYDPSIEYDVYRNHDEIKVMNRYLGALTSLPGSSLSDGLYYQWGRKDPFTDNATTTPRAEVDASSLTECLSYSISHPQYFITGDTWFNDEVDTSLRGNSITKYDPCPAGWKVAGCQVWSGFPFGYYSDFDNSLLTWFFSEPYSYPGCYYPLCGGLNKFGKVYYLCQDLWTSDYGYHLGLGLDGQFNFHTDTVDAAALPVRCCKEE